MQDEEFGALGECVDAGLVVTDDAGVVIYANSHFAALFGLPAGRLVGKLLGSLVDLPVAGVESGRVGVRVGDANLDLHVYGIVAGHHEPHRLLLFASRAAGTEGRDVAERYRLSPREADILTHAVEGMRAEAIAEHCGISAHTVRNHLKSIYRKLDVHSRVELMRRCLEEPAAAERSGG